MTQRLTRYLVGALTALVLASSVVAMRAEAADPAALAGQLKARYDLVALKDGLGLVPHDASKGRLIEVRDGGVALNGEALSAKELRAKLGSDADLILKVTFLSLAEQRALAGPALGALPAPPAPPTPPTGGGAPPPPAAPDGQAPARTQTRDGDVVRIGDSITVGRDELVKGDVVIVGGSADVDGEITGDVNVVGGSLRLGPSALVRKDVVVVGGTLNRDPAARVLGKIDEVGIGDMSRMARRGQRERAERMVTRRTPGRSLLVTLLRGVLLTLVALLVMTLGRRHVELLAARVAAEPVRAGLVGLLAEIGFAPVLVITIVVLAVSIIGIPLLLLLPFAMVLLALLALVGFSGVAAQAGTLASRRLGLELGPHATVALGVAAILVVTLLGKLVGLVGGFFGGAVGGTLTAVGFAVEYVSWTVGLGAVILTWFHGRRGLFGRGGQAAEPASPTAPTAPPPEILGDDVPPFERH